jgi:lysophospholipid acyltransferase (LPLAT)-like uncharacterized protein
VKWRPPPRLAATLGGPLIGLLARSWRIEVRAADRWERLVRERRRFAFLLWHEMLLPLLWHHRRQGIAIVVSEARDGRYLAQLGARLGYRTLFGSSTRGGARVLRETIRVLAEGTPVAFTPDGPRGPRREIKPGAMLAAQRGEALILPIAATADRAWHLRSWDRFLIPKPRARVRIGYGEPYFVAAGDEGLAAGSRLAADALHALERELAWPDGATATA